MFYCSKYQVYMNIHVRIKVHIHYASCMYINYASPGGRGRPGEGGPQSGRV